MDGKLPDVERSNVRTMPARHPSSEVMMIPATMISRAAPSTAMAISPALYFAPGFAPALLLG